MMTGKTAWFDALCRDIASLKIQGAENIARAGVEGLARLHAERPEADLAPYVARLVATRPTEPMLRNAVQYYLKQANGANKTEVLEHLQAQFDSADERIALYVEGLITDSKSYFTHCHSSTVTRGFLKAWQDGKRFNVSNTETRPRYQGRITATELAAAGIPVTHYIDSAARVALKGCSAVFLGADALLDDAKVANKIGSETIALLAARAGIPVYVVANSWKYDPDTAHGYKERLELREAREVWRDAPRGVRVENPAFELIDKRYITAIITEHGIKDPASAIGEIRRRFSLLIDEKRR